MAEKHRSHDTEEAATIGYPTFAVLYGPLGFFIERLWMGERRARLLKGLAGLVPCFGDV